MEIGRLIGIKEFEGERENFVLNTFVYFKPVKTVFRMLKVGGGVDRLTKNFQQPFTAFKVKRSIVKVTM